jgi:hypothetical protein
LSFDALYAHGIHNPVATDLNLDSFPRFTLDNEQRAVFAPSGAIVQATGATSLSGSRYYPFFGTAYEFGGGISSRTGQFTVQLTRDDRPASSTGAGLDYFSIGYTLVRSRDQSNGFPFSHALPNTAGDPRRREWGTSDLERRHTVTVTGLIGLARSLELGLIGRITSGASYTPMVNGDVNGDGLFNDRAFVFSPASASPADTAVVNGMQRLLARASPRTRRCLERQTDRIAGRNSCSTSWQSALDVQLNWRPSGATLNGRVMISLVAVNTLTGLDALLHGGKLKGWGQPASPDILLLNVRAFDPATRRFSYTVNEHFGVPSARDNPFRVPFQIGLHIHAQLGAAGGQISRAESGG